MTALKQVLVDALDDASHPTSYGSRWFDPWDWESDDAPVIDNYVGHFDLDRLAKAVTDHFLDREKVRAALIDACDGDGIICDDPLIIERTIDDEFIDRLIAGLSGGSE